MTLHHTFPVPPSFFPALLSFLSRGAPLLLAAFAALAALATSGCALDEEQDLELAETTAALSGEQVYAISNIYNAGGAGGYVGSFASIQDYPNMRTSQSWQEHFWPGGPWAGGSLGAAITYDGLRLPSYWSTGVVVVPSDGTAFNHAVDNSNDLASLLIQRTPYAAYFSLGSLITSAIVQAQRSNPGLPDDLRQASWNLARSMFRDARNLAKALCHPSATVWKTAFNVQEMDAVLTRMPPTPFGYAFEWGTSTPAEYLRIKLTELQTSLGNTISNPATLESGAHGIGCEGIL